MYVYSIECNVILALEKQLDVNTIEEKMGDHQMDFNSDSEIEVVQEIISPKNDLVQKSAEE